MKANLIEYDGCFSVYLVAETPEESISLVRFGINKTKDIRSMWVNAKRGSDHMEANIVLGKRRRVCSNINQK